VIYGSYCQVALKNHDERLCYNVDAMSIRPLATDDDIRDAARTVGTADAWNPERQDWIGGLASVIDWVKAADQEQRTTREFHERLWERNRVARLGQGNVSIDRALDDERFRTWVAARSMQPLPESTEERRRFIATFYQDVVAQLTPYLKDRFPHAKVFCAIAALYPEVMTTVASRWRVARLARAMGAAPGLEPGEPHVWARWRLDTALGDPGHTGHALAERMVLAWILFTQFVRPGASAPADDDATLISDREDEMPADDEVLEPLPAARRRRGLTAIKGLFPATLSALEFARKGVTRDELLDFLRASSPDAKASSLGMAINVYRSELGVMRLEGSQYVLTERGERVLESQDALDLADWLLTRVLAVDRAIVELRDRGELSAADLIAAIRAMNPGWTSNFAPQGMVQWLRSMNVVRSGPQSTYALSDAGRVWASRIHWTPEPLGIDPPLPVDPPPPPIPPGGGRDLPAFSAIRARVAAAGQFTDGIVASLHAGLWSHARRHFAILTGLSGAGKTLLAREYAKALAPEGEEPRLLTLPVQPGWYDPGPLLGYVNPLRGDSYVSAPFLDFITTASGDPKHAYVVVLDEMNLSHPEQYMAPLLSAMETGDALKLHSEGDFFDGVPGTLPYPANLVIIGTVNMDETTHGLSDKVLDRAFVLEFWQVDLETYPGWGQRRIDAADESVARKVLGELMAALSPARLHFGWRIVDDVLDFLERAATVGDALSFSQALDGVIYARVLPKLRGEDGPRLREALARCETSLASSGLTRSRLKVAELRHDLQTTGAARFWR
jgi:5-methylcytosine-specific restriction enzyme B